MPRLNAVPAQHGGGGRHLERVPAVHPADPADQPERLKLGQLLLVDPGRVEQLPPAQRAAGRGARGAGSRGLSALVGWPAPSADGGTSRSLITRSGRYWSRWAVRM